MDSTELGYRWHNQESSELCLKIGGKMETGNPIVEKESQLIHFSLSNFVIDDFSYGLYERAF